MFPWKEWWELYILNATFFCRLKQKTLACELEKKPTIVKNKQNKKQKSSHWKFQWAKDM